MESSTLVTETCILEMEQEENRLAQTFHFFQSFLDIQMRGKNGDYLLKRPEFRDYVLETLGRTKEAIHIVSSYYCNYICRPQRLLFDCDEYYICHDFPSNTYYICMRDVTMIDIDFNHKTDGGGLVLDKSDVDDVIDDVDDKIEEQEAINEQKVDAFRVEYIKWLVSECDQNRDWRFAIFWSRKGLHVFPVHTILQGDNRIDMQLRLKCDFWYTIYTYLRMGSSIRLNAKANEQAPIYSFIGYLGHGQIDENLDAQVFLHYHLQGAFLDLGESRMK